MQTRCCKSLYIFCMVMTFICPTLYASTDDMILIDDTSPFFTELQASAAGIFTYGLFNIRPSAPYSVSLEDLPVEGTGWIELIEKRVELNETQYLLYNEQQMFAYAKEFSIAEFKQAINNKIASYKTQERAMRCNNQGTGDAKCDTFLLLSEAPWFKEQIEASLKNSNPSQRTNLTQCGKELRAQAIGKQCSALYKLHTINLELDELLDLLNVVKGESPEEEIVFPFELVDDYLDVCEEEKGEGGTTKSLCLVEMLATDYENTYEVMNRLPLSKYKAFFESAAEFDPAQKRAMENKLTALMEQIRQTLLTTLNSHKIPQGQQDISLQTVKVVIEGTGLNINAKKGAPTLTISSDILRDIYLRAFYRAAVVSMANVGEQFADILFNGFFNEIQFTDPAVLKQFEGTPYYYAKLNEDIGYEFESLQQDTYESHMLYSNTVQEYGNLLNGLKGIKQYIINFQAIHQALLTIPDIDKKLSFKDSLQKVAEQANEKPMIFAHQTMPVSFEAWSEISDVLIAELPDAARNGRLSQVQRMYDNLIEMKPMAGEILQTEMLVHQYFLSELVFITQALNAELLKSYAFFLAHESWHIWFGNERQSPRQFKQEEFKADAHAARVFLEQFEEFDYEWWSSSIDASFIEQTSAPSSVSDFFQQFTGRNPDIVLEETYKGTRFYDGNFSHPPIEQRTEIIKNSIKEGRHKFSQQLVQEYLCQFNRVLVQQQNGQCEEL